MDQSGLLRGLDGEIQPSPQERPRSSTDAALKAPPSPGGGTVTSLPSFLTFSHLSNLLTKPDAPIAKVRPARLDVVPLPPPCWTYIHALFRDFEKIWQTLIPRDLDDGERHSANITSVLDSKPQLWYSVRRYLPSYLGHPVEKKRYVAMRWRLNELLVELDEELEEMTDQSAAEVVKAHRKTWRRWAGGVGERYWFIADYATFDEANSATGPAEPAAPQELATYQIPREPATSSRSASANGYLTPIPPPTGSQAEYYPQIPTYPLSYSTYLPANSIYAPPSSTYLPSSSPYALSSFNAGGSGAETYPQYPPPSVPQSYQYTGRTPLPGGRLPNSSTTYGSMEPPAGNASPAQNPANDYTYQPYPAPPPPQSYQATQRSGFPTQGPLPAPPLPTWSPAMYGGPPVTDLKTQPSYMDMEKPRPPPQEPEEYETPGWTNQAQDYEPPAWVAEGSDPAEQRIPDVLLSQWTQALSSRLLDIQPAIIPTSDEVIELPAGDVPPPYSPRKEVSVSPAISPATEAGAGSGAPPR